MYLFKTHASRKGEARILGQILVNGVMKLASRECREVS